MVVMIDQTMLLYIHRHPPMCDTCASYLQFLSSKVIDRTCIFFILQDRTQHPTTSLSDVLVLDFLTCEENEWKSIRIVECEARDEAEFVRD